MDLCPLSCGDEVLSGVGSMVPTERMSPVTDTESEDRKPYEHYVNSEKWFNLNYDSGAVSTVVPV